jgi:CRP/FNR family transcriptional regulator, cyclic AMP receptor protein
MTDITTMKQRFEGKSGKRLLIEALQSQKIAYGNAEIAEAIANKAELIEVGVDGEIIKENDSTNDIYFILAGTFHILVKGSIQAVRGPNDHVGEMAAIDPSQKRSACVIAVEESVVCRLSENELAELANQYPIIWRNLAVELCKRLVQRNEKIGPVNDKARVFIMSSAEALPIAEEVQSNLSHHCLPVVWTNGIFKVSQYPIESLEEALLKSDFAIAIAQADDLTESRGVTQVSPRDNVLFELGFFMGCLGRKRTILMEPSEADVKIPSDLKGLNTVRYKTGSKEDLPLLLGPACLEIKKLIENLGAKG